MDKEYLTIKNYKEPLIKVKDGYGYYGAISVSIDGKYIQCHVCGQLFKSLLGHLKSHNKNVKEYREEYQLAKSTALISEEERDRLKTQWLEKWKSMTDEEKKEMANQGRKQLKKNRAQSNTLSLETKNKRGTCPDQLLDKIKEVANKSGKTPTLSEFMDYFEGQRYKHLIFKTFGSWKNALKMLNMEPRKPNLKGNKLRYTDDELLEYLNMYWRENNKIPTASDSKRGLIPNYEIYKRRFGSFPYARELAGIDG